MMLFPPSDGFHVGSPADLDLLLRTSHYLGPIESGEVDCIVIQVTAGMVVAGQVWRPRPTARHLPQDGSWLELSRWVLTPAAGKNAGSRMHGWTVRYLRRERPMVTTLVSYSDPSVGHTGALYRSCNWQWRPTWMRLRPPPSGHGSWDGENKQAVKDRWVFELRRDERREAVLAVKDAAAVRSWEASGSPVPWRLTA
jgi:hypothetical protein